MRTEVYWMCCTLVLTGCGTDASKAQPTSIIGTVIDEAGQPLPGASVSVQDQNSVTNQAGTYSLAYPGFSGQFVAVNFKAPGFPQTTRRIQMPASGPIEVNVALRPIDQSSYFVLPTGDQNITFNVTHTGASAVLTIPGDALVDPLGNGNIATGPASVEMTFWSPDDAATTYPGALRASDHTGDPRDSAPINLLTYGMVAIDIYQNSHRLQVAPGKLLNLTIQTTGQRRDAIAARPASVVSWPSMWTLNPNSGVWDEDVGDSTFDVTTGQLVGVLRHLSTINADEPYDSSGPPVGDSGCFTGRVTGACGQGIPNAHVVINLANGPGGVGGNETITTDANGLYKFDWSPAGHTSYFAKAQWSDRSGLSHSTDITQSPLPPTLIETSQTGTGISPTSPRIVAVAITCSDVSGTCQNAACSCFNDPSNPGGCMTALIAGDPNDVNGYNPCWVNPLSSDWLGPCYDDLLTGGTTDWHFNAVWNYQPEGTLCQNCWPLVDLVFKDVAGDQSAGCTGAGAYGTGCCPAAPPPGVYNICDDLAAVHRTVIGQPCIPGTDTCCEDAQSGAVPLDCIDQVCVPRIDPTEEP